MWHKGEIKSLISEGKRIENHLHRRIPQTDDDDIIARTFRDIMLRGNVRSALNYLSRKTNGGVLQLDGLIPEACDNGETLMRSSRDILNDKHPNGKVLPSSWTALPSP